MDATNKILYPTWAQILGGWLISALVFAAGFIVAFLCKKVKKLKTMVDKESVNEKTWDEMEAINETDTEDAFAMAEEVVEA